MHIHDKEGRNMNITDVWVRKIEKEGKLKKAQSSLNQQVEIQV